MIARPTAASAAATTITKKTKTRPSELVMRAREGHERQIHGVEHQLDGHENRDDVALEHERDDAQPEQNGAQHQIIGNRERRSFVLLRQNQRAQNGDQNQDGSRFKREQILLEKHASDRSRVETDVFGAARTIGNLLGR